MTATLNTIVRCPHLIRGIFGWQRRNAAVSPYTCRTSSVGCQGDESATLGWRPGAMPSCAPTRTGGHRLECDRNNTVIASIIMVRLRGTSTETASWHRTHLSGFASAESCCCTSTSRRIESSTLSDCKSAIRRFDSDRRLSGSTPLTAVRSLFSSHGAPSACSDRRRGSVSCSRVGRRSGSTWRPGGVGFKS